MPVMLNARIKKAFQAKTLERLHPVYLVLSKLTPESCNAAETRLSFLRQVFWLSDQPNVCTFPIRFIEQWYFAEFVPDHSGGTAPDSNGISY